METQEQLVNEALALYRELVRSALAAKAHHHANSFQSTPEHCAEGAEPLEASLESARRKPENLPEAQIKLVVHLAIHGAQTMSEVADGLEVTTPAVTGLVDKLEKRGMVERVRDQQDRRVVRVCLAPHAQQMAEEHLTERRRQVRAVLDTLAPEEQLTFIKTFRLLVQTLYPKQEAEIISR